MIFKCIAKTCGSVRLRSAAAAPVLVPPPRNSRTYAIVMVMFASHHATFNTNNFSFVK
jgi:hypothetical protein